MSTFQRFGLGTYQLTGEQCAESVRTAIDAGYRLIDSAQGYQNEALVREGIAGSDADASEVFVATKLSTRNLAYEDAIDTAYESAARLGVESIDLLYVHWPLNTYDEEGTIEALNELHEAGLVDRVGLSNFRPDQLEAAIERLDPSLFAHQVECHPLLQQEKLRAAAREDGHHLVAYSPLSRGEVGEVEVLQEIAAGHDVTPFQASIAWLLSKESVAVIPKATSESHIRENLAAVDLTLTDEEIDRIDAIDTTDRQVDFEDAPWNQVADD
ncbi:MAG: aldo/keto reductase [Halobacteriaceae archaeon]